ncbi:hypothetical protein QJS10_CPB19g00388 [Acorus calamus]|uniref:Uncharacterized protein n=1 Tax=Acorus calamus TaxID=4465 RepID=A0AAV9CI45_ACOCL|nr:hypothetical protein QJS10_CPB19g00388 [Acorus calamus]
MRIEHVEWKDLKRLQDLKRPPNGRESTKTPLKTEVKKELVKTSNVSMEESRASKSCQSSLLIHVKDLCNQRDDGTKWIWVEPNYQHDEVDKSVWEPYLELQQIFGDTVAHGGGSRTTNQLDTSAPIEVTNLDGSQSPKHQFGFNDDDMAESVSPKPPHTSDSKRRKS